MLLSRLECTNIGRFLPESSDTFAQSPFISSTITTEPVFSFSTTLLFAEAPALT